MRTVYWFIGAIISGITFLIFPLSLMLLIGNNGYYFFESMLEIAKKIVNTLTY